MHHDRRLPSLIGVSLLAIAALDFSVQLSVGQSGPAITVGRSVPSELNPPFNSGPPSTGGAPTASPAEASAFAWQEFIALNWPAGPQTGQSGQRDTPSSTCRFGDPSPSCALLVWETLRGKVEIFPGDGNAPTGFSGSAASNSWGYDALPAYIYGGGAISACDMKQAHDATPWINLDETDQITLDSMYAGVVAPASSPGNSSPQLIRFLAKANRSQYVYVVGNSDPNDRNNQWWSQIPATVVSATKTYLKLHQASPPPNSKMMVSLPDGTIEMKAGWRPLNPSEISSGRFHTQMVRFYELAPDFSTCYRDAEWGLVSLHIIQKTPSAPYFIYATFEQADNILTADAKPVEDSDGNIILRPPPPTVTSPQVCLLDPQPPVSPPPPNEITSALGSVIFTSAPTTCKPLPTASYCGAPGSQLFYHNENPNSVDPPVQPIKGDICVNKRDNAIPDYVIAANKQAHAAISNYLKLNNIKSAPWLFYKLINVQYYPYDKIPNPRISNGSPYTAQPPYTAANPAPSSYYQANIVVETNRSLQLFAGGLSLGGGGVSTEWNQDGTPHKNTYYGGHFFNMGGCMGCHGSQGQFISAMQAGDFSVILARGVTGTGEPEVPAIATSQGLSKVQRNRTLK